MFGNAKPAGSLTSSLLARKGQARPAMRPQGFVALTPAPMEDLGWNDLGDASVPAPVPPVLRQREALSEELGAVSEPSPPQEPARQEARIERKVVPHGTAAQIAREVDGRRSKAAFTLRLDPERHLRLRLASAMENRSAQRIVTAALDAYLQSAPEVEDLARQVSLGKSR